MDRPRLSRTPVLVMTGVVLMLIGLAGAAIDYRLSTGGGNRMPTLSVLTDTGYLFPGPPVPDWASISLFLGIAALGLALVVAAAVSRTRRRGTMR